MKRALLHLSILVLMISLFQSCTVNNVKIDDKIGKFFKAKELVGTFGMFDNSRGDFTIYNLERFRENFPPGQSFMLFSKLVGLHTGKLAIDTIEIEFDALNQMIGKDTLQYWVDSVKYGNKKWKKDSLMISADEQLGLMKRLYFKQLPFRASVQEAIKKQLIVENNAQHQLAYQKNEVVYKSKKIVWLLGWIEENRHVYPFVLNYETSLDAETATISEQLCKEILTHIGFFKGIM
jgi:beta-lactamase class D